MPDTKQTRIPTPLYAAAGASDLAYQQLRKLPSKVSQLRGRAVEFRPVVTDLTSKAELDRLRTVAKRNADSFIASAQTAQERAVAVYDDLVTRGERVVRGARTEAAGELKAAADVVVDAAAEIETAAGAVAPEAPRAAVTAPVTSPETATVQAPAARRSAARKRTKPAAE